MSAAHVWEWAGCILGLAGALLLATNSRVSRYGWVAFLAANIAMIAFALAIGAHGLLLQQFGFLGTSCLGLYRVGLLPPAFPWSQSTMSRQRVHVAFINLQLAYQLRAKCRDAASCELVNEAEREWREAQRQECTRTRSDDQGRPGDRAAQPAAGRRRH